MAGWSIEQICEYCHKKGWKVLMRIRVTEVGKVKKEDNYFLFELKYEDKGKEYTRKVRSFNKAEYDTLKTASPGQEFDIKLEKNKNGFWEWKEVEMAGSAPSSNSGTGGGKQWVPDEVRQRMIIRQSSLGHAITFLNHSVDPKDITVQQVLDVAGEFEAWVNRE